MQRIILYVAVTLCLLMTKIYGQEQTFEERAKNISENIKKITQQEKESLKQEIEDINKLLDNGTITFEKAEAEKLKVAEIRAKNIEERVSVEETKLQQLIKDDIEGKVIHSDKKVRGGYSIVIGSNPNDSIGKDHTEVNLGSMKVYNGREDKLKRNSKRTTSQFVWAFGLNNHITDGDLSSIDESGLRVWGSRFFEWGVSWNTRLLKDHNLLHAKYGLSFMYNTVRTVNDLHYVKDGNQTHLEYFGRDIKSSKFRNVQMVVPVHLEFDFTPKRTNEDGKSIFKTHESFRLGIGGFGGFNIKTKQITKYKEDGVSVRIREKDDFNTPTFVYGLSAYVGHGQTALYVKYNLNPVFKDNPVEQNNISIGLRFDFN